MKVRRLLAMGALLGLPTWSDALEACWKITCRNVMGIVKFLILVALTWEAMGAFGRSIKDDMPPREFSLLPADVKTNICQDVLTGLTQKDAFLGLVQMFPEDRLYETWKNLSDAEEDFFFMRKLGFRHTRVIRTF